MSCNYELSKLATHRCPECSRTFDPSDARSFNQFEIYEHNLHDFAMVILGVLGIVVGFGLLMTLIEWIRGHG